jgi:hypothetical protein
MIGAAYGAASLAYPLTLDSGVNGYVAREWLLRGSLPYRDSFDHRAPGIYVLHAACIALFGQHAWGIRVAELGAVVALGWLGASAATPLGERTLPGARGAAVLAAATFYYGFFDFWGTAQCELWTALGVVGALCAVRRASGELHAAALAGIACGAALLFKPPALPLVVVVAGVLGVRVARGGSGAGRQAAAAATFLGAILALPAVTVAYFAARGGLPALADVLLRANAYYVAHEPPEYGPGAALHGLALAWRFFAPFDTLVVLLLVVGGAWAWWGRRATRGTYVVAAALLVATVIAATVQRKLYLYHWVLASSTLAILAPAVLRDLARTSGARGRALSALALAAAVVGSHARSGGPFDVWARTTRATLAWATGRSDRAQLLGAYSKLEHFYGQRFDYADRERLGLWLRDHSDSDDRILVRGMAGEVYLIARRRAPGRFFWSLFLTLPTRAYRRDQWLREDLEAVEREPPRFVVVQGEVREGPDSAEWFRPLGYRERERVAGFVILERPPVAPSAVRYGAVPLL